jgi:DNA-binding MarR family transcriptional regulator
LKGQYPEAATVNLLIDRMLDKSSNASRIVERLRQKGLIKRKICKVDRRRVDVIITELGLELVDKASRDLEKIQSSKLGLSESEAITLSELLDKLRNANTPE